MNILILLFWAVVIVIWIVSTLTKKQASSPPGEAPKGEEGYRKPEEALERFLRRMTGEEEEMQATPPFEPRVEREVPPPQPQVKMVAPPRPEEPLCKVEPAERKEKIKSCLPGLLDRSTVRQGIILAEILGPPRAERPL